MTHTEATLAAALAYASRRWPVFPCRPGGKEPATRHGFHDASTDPAQIRTWWQHHPDANLAVATGHPGPDVLDIDHHGPAASGYPAYHQLKKAGLIQGAHTIIATPGGGLHLYFTGSTQPSGRLPRHHIDFKATGGYVLAPPSQVNGHPYQLLRIRPGQHGLAWTAVTTALEPDRSRPARPRTTEPADLTRLAGWVERLAEGNRNAGLYWAACRAVEAGHDGLLDDLATAAAKTGLTDREITRTLASARRGPPRPPQHHAEHEAAK
jgi:hypothetical protein